MHILFNDISPVNQLRQASWALHICRYMHACIIVYVCYNNYAWILKGMKSLTAWYNLVQVRLGDRRWNVAAVVQTHVSTLHFLYISLLSSSFSCFWQLLHNMLSKVLWWVHVWYFPICHCTSPIHYTCNIPMVFDLYPYGYINNSPWSIL